MTDEEKQSWIKGYWNKKNQKIRNAMRKIAPQFRVTACPYSVSELEEDCKNIIGLYPIDKGEVK